MKKNYYEKFGITENASQKEIKKAYRKLALRYHPDKNGGDLKSENIFKQINNIYQILSDPIKRQKYDSELRKKGSKEADSNSYYENQKSNHDNSNYQKASSNQNHSKENEKKKSRQYKNYVEKIHNVFLLLLKKERVFYLNSLIKIFIISILGVLIYLGTIIYVNKNKTNKSNNINNKTTQIISEENNKIDNNKNQKLYKVGCIGFYNLENLFDTIHQKGEFDSEFTPTGKYNWTSNRYKIKINHLAEVISQIGDELIKSPPVIMGLSEIENRNVIDDLIRAPILKSSNYGVVYYNSSNRNNKNVAFIYQKNHFKVLVSYPVNSLNSRIEQCKTNDQLVIYGLFDGYPLNIIINQWKKRDNQIQGSETFRISEAKLCRLIVDSILKKDRNSRIIIMGDFNDNPTDKSILDYLGTTKTIEDTKPEYLYNPMWKLYINGNGSLVDNNKWNLFDQIIVSYNLLGNDYSTYKFFKAKIFNNDFLTKKEDVNKNYPWSTYEGLKWSGGYSNHFPVYIFLVKDD